MRKCFGCHHQNTCGTWINTERPIPASYGWDRWWRQDTQALWPARLSYRLLQVTLLTSTYRCPWSSQNVSTHLWWFKPVTPAHRRQRQGYLSLRAAWAAYTRPHQTPKALNTLTKNSASGVSQIQQLVGTVAGTVCANWTKVPMLATVWQNPKDML